MKSIYKRTYIYKAFGGLAALGLVLAFGAAVAQAAAPTFVTTPATSVTTTGAVLNGAWNGNGTMPTSMRFEYGTTPALGSTTSYQQKTTTDGPSGQFTATLTGLSPATTYYFRAMGVNASGVGFASSTLNFSTKAVTTPCSITSFAANPSTIPAGSSTMLAWTTTGCSSAQIGGIGAVTPVSGGTVSTGTVSATKTYTLTAVNGTSADTRTLTVTTTSSSGTTDNGTTGSGTTSSGTTTCAITSFSAQPSTVSYGRSATLYWSLFGNCSGAYISNGIGSIGMSGSYPTGPLTYSTTYTLSATDAVTGANVTRQAFIGVTADESGYTGTGTGYGTTSSYGTGSYMQPCVVNSFSVSPTTIESGRSATLFWTTTGCQNATISGGSLYGSYAPVSGSMQTGPVYGTTLFTLSANGMNGSTTASTTLSVINSQYAYSYACPPGSYDPSCRTQYSANFVTTPATNIGATSARLNGLALNTPDTFASYFEYGTTPSLGRATSFQSLGNVTSYTVSATIGTTPSTTYYYRLVSQIAGGATIRGDILSFTTLPADTVVYVTETNSGTGTTGTSTGGSSTGASATAANGILVTVATKSDKVSVGDTAEYTVTYSNGSGKTLTGAVLTIVLPQGFTVIQSTQGVTANPTTITISLGTLAPGQSGSAFVQAKVGPNTMLNATLVTNATLSYALPSGAHDSAVGYVLNHATASNAFAGFALGGGFFPSTIFGWFLTIIIILIIILLARRISKQKHAGGHGDSHH